MERNNTTRTFPGNGKGIDQRKADRSCGSGGHVQTTSLGWEPSCTCGTTAGRPCLVLDPFAGSGTTLATAKRLGRRALGIELNETYIRDHIVPRCRQQAMFLEALP